MENVKYLYFVVTIDYKFLFNNYADRKIKETIKFRGTATHGWMAL